MTSALILRLAEIRTRIDALEEEVASGDTNRIDAYAAQLLGMRRELQELCAATRAALEQEDPELSVPEAENDLNAIEETLEAAADAAVQIGYVRREMGLPVKDLDAFAEDMEALLQRADAFISSQL